jgi:hypothetical protein
MAQRFFHHPHLHVVEVSLDVSSCWFSERGQSVRELAHSRFLVPGFTLLVLVVGSTMPPVLIALIAFILPARVARPSYDPSKGRPFLERIRNKLAYGSNCRRRTVAVAKRVIKESLACSCVMRNLALKR